MQRCMYSTVYAERLLRAMHHTVTLILGFQKLFVYMVRFAEPKLEP
jgi:hypothetical protein